MMRDCRATRRLFPVAAAAVLLTGCTMCPNPFDYAGPVPNGSSTQNDFRARSNGIIPIGSMPQPWPMIVKDEADEPTIAQAPADGTGVVPVSGDGP